MKNSGYFDKKNSGNFDIKNSEYFTWRIAGTLHEE